MKVSAIANEGILEEKVVCRNFRHTTQHGAIEGKTQSKEVKYSRQHQDAWQEGEKKHEGQ